MSKWLQQEWQRNSPWQIVLRPLAWLFGALAALRRALYRSGLATSTRLPVPVIVVGNISVGGAGKTPLVIALVEVLRRAGLHPGIVSRGYGAVADDHGEFAGAVLQSNLQGVAAPDWFGDEPVMMAARLGCPVFVGRDRPRIALALLTSHPEVDVIISDDGLQHYALRRDIEIAVVDGERGSGNGQLLPAGPLREPEARLAEVDMVVVNAGKTASLPSIAAGAVPRFSMRLGNERFVMLQEGARPQPTQFEAQEFAQRSAGRNIHAVAGIGNPRRFFEHLRALGVSFTAHTFPDHHAFTARDLRLPSAEVVLMTEKDAVKCGAFADERMWFMRIDALLPAAFDEQLLALLDTADGRKTA